VLREPITASTTIAKEGKANLKIAKSRRTPKIDQRVAQLRLTFDRVVTLKRLMTEIEKGVQYGRRKSY
jgi:hypothetical protein